MSNSKKDKKTKSESSFNKSKSISNAMDDLEMGRPISKAVPDSELGESISGHDLNKDSLDVDELGIGDSSSKNHEDIKSNEEEKYNEDLESIFVSPDNGISEDFENIGENYLNEEIVANENLNLENVLSLSKPNKKNTTPYTAKKSTKRNNKFDLMDRGFNEKSSVKELSMVSKIFSIIVLILGLGLIVYGIRGFSNISDRVIDNVLLGEAGSWGIVIILIGLILILLDVFYVLYYNGSLKNSGIKNERIRNTFNTIDTIKNIDGDYYKRDSEDSDSLFKNLLNLDKEESPEHLKNSNFTQEEIFTENFNKSNKVNFDDEFSQNENDTIKNISDSYDLDSDNDFEDGNTFFEMNKSNDLIDDESIELQEYLSDSQKDSFELKDLNIYENINEPKINKKSTYDELSSFLEDEKDINSTNSNKLSNLESKKEMSNSSSSKQYSFKDKSKNSNDLAAKKARIIEGTNFDNNLRKSRK